MRFVGVDLVSRFLFFVSANDRECMLRPNRQFALPLFRNPRVQVWRGIQLPGRNERFIALQCLRFGRGSGCSRLSQHLLLRIATHV